MMKTLFPVVMGLVLTALLTGCGSNGSDSVVITGPGLVVIDDSVEATAPLLTVKYTIPPSSELFTVNILSDPQSDGDVSFDPVLNTFTVTTGSQEIFFGENSLHPNLPEFRAFLTFPLDGFTGQPVVPGNAAIVSAFLDVHINHVYFASVVPAYLDLIQYPFRGLSAADFDTPLLTPTSFRAVTFFSSDEGNFVRLNVTSLMEEVQLPPALPDFQVRFSVDIRRTLLSSRVPSAETGRSVHPPFRGPDTILLNRGLSSEIPLTQETLQSRRR